MAGYLGTRAVLLSTTAADVTGDMTVAGATTLSGAFTSLGIDDNATSTAITIDASENVGIGTSSPTAKLDVVGGMTVQQAADIKWQNTARTTTYGGISSNASKLSFAWNDATAMTIDSSGNVGIGTADPSQLLQVGDGASGTGNAIRIEGRTTGGAQEVATLEFNQISNLPAEFIGASLSLESGTSRSNSALVFNVSQAANTSATEVMKIDASGNLLVGKTTVGLANSGVELREGAASGFTRNSTVMDLNRTGGDGEIMRFRKDGSTVGRIGSNGSRPYFYGGSGIKMGLGGVQPCNSNGSNSDNDQDLGSATVRWDDVYATNGTIQTSDRNEKQQIAVMDAAETRVAVSCKGLLRKFRWKDAVADKGDDARIHFGIIAQDLQDAFTAEGLDAGRYAMFISSTWWETQTDVPAVVAVDEVLDEDGGVVTEAVDAVDAYTRTDTFDEVTEGATERTRLGVRYPELLAFIIGAL